MSTADTELNVGSVALVHDVIKKITPSNINEVRLVSVTTFVMGSGAVCLAMQFTSILDAMLFSYLLWYPVMICPLLFGIYGLKSNDKSFIATTIITAISVIIFHNTWSHNFALSIICGIGFNFIIFISCHCLFGGSLLFKVREAFRVTPKPKMKFRLNKTLFDCLDPIYKAPYIPFAFFTLSSFFAPHFIWPERIEPFFTASHYMTLASGAGCVILILYEVYLKDKENNFPRFWYANIMFSLPFATSFSLWVHDLNLVWVLIMTLSLWITSVLVDWIRCCIMTIVAMAASFLLYTLLGGSLDIADVVNIYSAIFAALIFFVIGWVFIKRKEEATQTIIKEKDDTIEEKETVIVTKDTTISEQAGALVAKDTTISEQAGTIEEQVETIEEKDSTILEQAGTIEDQAETISEQVETIEEKNRIIENLTKQCNAIPSEVNNELGVQSRILRNFNHELRTPMTSALTIVDLLAEDKLEEKQKKSVIHILHKSLNNFKDYIENITTVAAMEKQDLPLTKGTTNLTDLVIQVAKAFENLDNPPKPIHIKIEDKDDILADIDPNEIKRVLYAIFDNAIRYSKESVDIVVNVRRVDSTKVEVSIADNGVGIADAEKESVFMAFVESTETRLETGGKGLGLAVASAIIRSHDKNAYIKAENNAAGQPGTNIIFGLECLPIKSQKTVPVAKQTILLIDDEPSILMAHRMIFQRKGYTVFEAENGLEGMEMVCQAEE